MVGKGESARKEGGGRPSSFVEAVREEASKGSSPPKLKRLKGKAKKLPFQIRKGEPHQLSAAIVGVMGWKIKAHDRNHREGGWSKKGKTGRPMGEEEWGKITKSVKGGSGTPPSIRKKTLSPLIIVGIPEKM